MGHNHIVTDGISGTLGEVGIAHLQAARLAKINSALAKRSVAYVLPVYHL